MSSKSYRPKQAAEFIGIGLATVWRWSKTRPDFPQPIRLSARCTVFDGDQLAAWRDAQAAKVPAPRIICPSPAERLAASMQLLLPIAHGDDCQSANEPVALVEISTPIDQHGAVAPEGSCTTNDCPSVAQATDVSNLDKAACLAGQTKDSHHV